MVSLLRCSSRWIDLCAVLIVVVGCSGEAGLNDGSGDALQEEDEEAGRETLYRTLVSTGAGWTSKDVTGQVVLVEGGGAEQIVETTMEVQGSSVEADRSTVFEVRVPLEWMRAGQSLGSGERL